MPGKTRSRGNPDRPSRKSRPSRKARPSRTRTSGFLAIDGEGVTVNEGLPSEEHRFVLLGTSTGDFLWDDNGLATHEIFEFLLALKKKNPTDRMVGFFFNYDVNMILRDLTEGELKRLWVTARLIVTLENEVTYKIEWIPGKIFSFCRFYERRYVRISDVSGFFQTSFVLTLETWKIPDPGGHIARMKKERSNFTLKQRDQILRYCLAECDLLVELMGRLHDSLSGAELIPAGWHGAGAVAAKMLKKHGVDKHRVPDADFIPPVFWAIMHSYFGGRTEVFLQGVLDNVVNYDLCSAYPSQAQFLPSLARGVWYKTREYDPSFEYALWRCAWRLSGENSVMPFPFRFKGGIYYPENGMGWYHASEVRAAKKIYGDSICVLEGWRFDPQTECKPFSFIPDAYRQRQEAKARGHGSEKALKLGLNALYGKLAQGYGFMGSVPPFQSFFWAGMITAGTRARLLDMASENLSGVVSMATDGIVFSGDPEFPTGTELGALEKTYYDEIFIAQPGVYRAVKDTGEEVRRMRGFLSKEIDYEDLRRGWLAVGPGYEQVRKSTRFVGAGAALMREDLSNWRKWVTSDRSLTLHTSRKFYEPGVRKGKVMRLFPPQMPEGERSGVYKPKKKGELAGKDAANFVEIMEQPRELFL